MCGKQGLFRSRRSIQALIALSQAGAPGLSLREVASCLGAADSTAQRALAILREAHLLRRRGTRYQLASAPVLRELVTVALAELPLSDTLRVLVLANQAVEYASLVRARRGFELVVILRDSSDPVAVLQLRAATRAMHGQGVELTTAFHEDMALHLGDPDSPAQSLRRRALRGLCLKGTAARSLPGRNGRLRRPGRPLRRPHPSLSLPPRKRLRELADRFGLERIALFGSAVRSDFRAESDVDVAVRYRPGQARDLYQEVELEDLLEDLFDRDVDLVAESDLRPGVRERAGAELVAIHG